MGKEMGNNNTSAIKEEDNLSEADKEKILEDTSEHANEISQEENQNIPTSLSKDVMEKASKTSSDITIELGKDIPKEDNHANAYEKATWFDSNNTRSMLESDYSLEEDAHASELKMENQMHPTTEEELGKVSMQEEGRGDDVKEKSEMIQIVEAKDIEEKATSFISHNIESKSENDILEEDANESDINNENQMHPIDEAEDVDEKGMGVASEHTRSSIQSDLLKNKGDDEEIAAGLAYDDRTIEVGVQDESQEDKQDGEMLVPSNNDIDVEGKTSLASDDDPLILRNSFGGKEEDNISVSDKKNLQEDTSEHAKEISQKENQNLPTFLAKDVIEKSFNTSSDITIEHGKDIQQKDAHDADDVKEKIQTISIAESSDAYEKATWFDSNKTRSMLESDYSLEEDTHASDVNMENQIHQKAEEEDVEEKAKGLDSEDVEEDTHASDITMENQIHPKAEEEDVEEKANGLVSEDATTEVGKVSMQEESHDNDVKEKIQMIATDDVKDVEEKAVGLISHYIESKVENDSLKGDTNESDIDMENQMHQIDQAEDVEEKAIGMESEHTRSSLENDLLKSKDGHEIAAGLSSDGKTSELEDEDRNDGNMIILFNNDIDVQGKTTILDSSDDPSILGNSFGGEGEGMNGVIQPEKSPYAESVEGESCESLLSSSFEGSEECVKQEDSCLRKNLSVTYNHCLNEVSSIKQDEEETSVLALNNIDTSNDSELQESPSVHHDEVVKDLSEHSLQGNESLLKDSLPNADSHFQQMKHDVSEKYMESQENLICPQNSDGRDGNEFVDDLIVTSKTTSDPPSIGNNNIEENSKGRNEENKLSKSGSTNENPQDCISDQCIKDVQEYKSDMANTDDITIRSNGNCNGEIHKALDSSVLDAYVSNSIEVSYESSAALEENNSVAHEVESVFLIVGSTIVDCIHEKKENHSNKTEDTNEKPESSCVIIKKIDETNMLEQCNSEMVTINQEEYFSLQNSASLMHIYNYHQGNVEQTKSFTATTMPKSDEEAIEKEREDDSQHVESTSLIVEELTTSTELSSNNSIFAYGDYETRDSVTRLSTESNPDNPNITCQMQKSPSFNLNLRIEEIQAMKEESDQIPLLYKSENDSLSNKASINLSNSRPHDEYDHIEEKIVTMERSYSEISKASFIGFLKEDEEDHLLDMAQAQDSNAGSNMEVKEVSSVSPKGKEKRKSRSYFFTSCMCCATVPN